MRTFALGTTRHRRPAFTIIELMVALALVLFIMSIIAQVFGDASEAFRSQRAKAELSEKLRFLTQSIRADLRSRHFERGRRLSDPNFWQEGPPKSGYFRLEQQGFQTGSTSSAGDNFPVGTPNENHVMAFTSFLSGKTQGSFHSCGLDLLPGFQFWKNSGGLSGGDTRFEETPATYNSPDAEVAWFLGPSNDFTEYAMQDEPLAPSPGSVRLFKLYRRTWLMLPEEPAPLPAPQISSIGQPAVQLAQRISVVPGFNPPQLNIQTTAQSPSVDVPMRRAIGAYMPGLGAAVSTWQTAGFNSGTTPAESPDYLVADNVLSFTVEVLPEGGGAKFMPLDQAIGWTPQGASSSVRAVYDSWCGRPVDSSQAVLVDFTQWNIPGNTNQIPMLQNWGIPKLTAIRVTIRLYDTNNALSPSKTTWQATVVEPL